LPAIKATPHVNSFIIKLQLPQPDSLFLKLFIPECFYYWHGASGCFSEVVGWFRGAISIHWLSGNNRPEKNEQINNEVFELWSVAW